MILTWDDVRGWRTVRQYAVPAPMIRRATERRLAGDWRGACAAADVAVEVDLSALAGWYGTHVAATVEDDLRHLAPDLLRWHLPRLARMGRTALSPRRLWVLERYGRDGPILCAGGPRSADGRQQLRLFVADEHRGSRYQEPLARYTEQGPIGPRHQWDVRSAGELLTWYGLDYVPGFDRAGRPAAAAETVIHDLHKDTHFVEAWHLAGVDVLEGRYLPYEARARLGFWYRLPQIARAVRQAGAESGSDQVVAGYGDRPYLVFQHVAAERMRMTFGPPPRNTSYPFLQLERLGVPVDALLLHLGYVSPEHLHPLVHAAFFPEATTRPAGPPAPVAPGPVRVRCGGVWHEVRMRDGRLHIPHSEQEQQREAALAALGGALNGCFAVHSAWRAGAGRLPRRLKAQRRELMLRALHGDVDGVTALLDSGVDAHFRDHEGRTLLHFMPHLRDPRLLQRLLAAGLDVDARDAFGLTPLAAAVVGMCDVELIRALIEAGAGVDVTFKSGEPVAAWMEKERPAEFAALAPLLRPHVPKTG